MDRKPLGQAFSSLAIDANFVATAGPATVDSGQRLGLYKAMASLESVTPLQLAMTANASVWFTDGWLQAQASQGYAVFDPITERYSLFCRIAA
jgi:hypothetical protein